MQRRVTCVITRVLWGETKPRWQRTFLGPCLPLQEASPGNSHRSALPLQWVDSWSLHPPTSLLPRPSSLTLPSPPTSSALPLRAWTPPALPWPCSVRAPDQGHPPHPRRPITLCDISPGAITFPVSKPNPHSVLLF